MKRLTEFPYSNIVVLGLARSGTAAAEALLANDKTIRVHDKQATEQDETVIRLKEMGAEVIIGSHPISILDGMDLVIKNPGISYDNPIVAEAIRRDIPIITEIELAYYLFDGPIIGVTGSNGKTTTTTLVTDMLKKSERPVRVAGNIGIVATEAVQSMQDDEALVLELSSFQLQGTEKFRPTTAILLNIFEAHLDYHKTLSNYKQAKFNIFRNQTKDDYLIYNAEDKAIAEEVKDARAKLIPFSVHQKLEAGAWIDDKYVYFKNEKIIELKEIVLVGEHNLQNILAAIAAAKLNGATNEGIYRVLTTFSGVEHRLQFVENINGRLFYNDSKATNILATQKALDSFKQPTILLAGGLDRGNEFTDLKPHLKHVRAMVVFGQTASKLKELAAEVGIEKVIESENVEDAVHAAYSISEENEVILLSPACASWDQYRTFEERGDMFVQAVHKLM
ncbi:UDP-N-acetylmuramoyl-L-alanine--D-glutamate ligase [Oceanobacillus profundus]|uniref:UDP-N-acetylmuramoylalanine--D-glutamate ligase n=1 Tax=Oceanobacillus profundus TaxID=372463 RepID=A0A417YKJ0_9BACI|nr:UDP-N-acetylmuramoyl-L-alanine--D-glutamate ligase [Oceanobacillus profundus]MBR3119388.1 UDP-N-acetylmuramoyl-L-alanine--D-glutamate ligase [Oceanobacillus sp.]PAE30137.1 UDP-N-acetylmuramoyl-L-alanine--D-glutamate ligase [Paenibacillus sp. 7884-2]RHW33742.1 UDP-N-acetylmuramoyl-L-alanine--D-glutamate ligase [Oceanobacillus profundus]